MSDDEKYLIIGKVVSDHEASKKHLAAVKAKAKALAELLYIVGSALSDEATWTLEDRTFDVKRRTGGSLRGAWPELDVVAETLREIAATKTRIADLEQQRKDLGV